MGQRGMRSINPRMRPPIRLKPDRIKANGISWQDGEHLRLLTDLRDETVVNELIKVFDRAVPEWCQRFSVPEDRTPPWKMTVIVMQSPDSLQRFRAAGLIPRDLPPFPAGYNRDHEIWMYYQPSPYYTRHLLLHEGTHAFMQWFLKGSGPPWFSEGMAELMAVHRWKEGKLRLGLKSATSKDTEYWGRPEIIVDDVASGAGRTLQQVIAIPNNAFRNVENYAWAWAACRFLDQHPKSQNDFRTMEKVLSQKDDSFNKALLKKLKKSWRQLEVEWDLYIREMDYGYSIENAEIVRAEKSEKTHLKFLHKKDGKRPLCESKKMKN